MNASALACCRHSDYQPVQRTPQQAASTALAASRSTQTSGALAIQTDDGDTVTLSFSALQSLSVAAIESQSSTTKIQAGSSTSSNSTQFSVSIEGDLDQGEWADILKLARKFFSAIKDISRNDPERAAARMARVHNLDSLAGFAYTLQRQDSITAAASTASQA